MNNSPFLVVEQIRLTGADRGHYFALCSSLPTSITRRYDLTFEGYRSDWATDRVALEKQGADLVAEENSRLFIGCFPCGLVYADRKNEEHGDYKRLAFLPYDSLSLDLAKDCPPLLRFLIQEHAATMKPGEQFQIAGNATVTLGTKTG